MLLFVFLILVAVAVQILGERLIVDSYRINLTSTSFGGVIVMNWTENEVQRLTKNLFLHQDKDQETDYNCPCRWYDAHDWSYPSYIGFLPENVGGNLEYNTATRCVNRFLAGNETMPEGIPALCRNFSQILDQVLNNHFLHFSSTNALSGPLFVAQLA
jgi:hypothetical protein